jgi:predicted DNA-binding protein with PD1-like motif
MPPSDTADCHCHYTLAETQDKIVRCPGHTIHYMVFGYEVFVRQVLQLTGLAEQEDRRQYESWNPYRLQDVAEDQP